MTRPRGRLARRVALAASDRRRVVLTHHEADVDVERRVLPNQDVARLDNGPLSRPQHLRSARKRRGAEGAPTPPPTLAEPNIPPDADRVGVVESELAGTIAADAWADVLTASAADGEPLVRGKTRKQIDRTLRGKGLYLFVAAGMHSAATAKKAKGRAAARRKTVEEAARGRRSVAAHWPEHLPLFDAALQHALVHPAPLPPSAPVPPAPKPDAALAGEQ